MLKKKCIIGLALIGVTISGCSIKQSVEPAELQQEAKVCIVDNPQVRDSFLEELKSAVDDRGIMYEVVSSGNTSANCEWKVTYTANWTWDLALYMSYARISVFHNGELDGEAIYDSTAGSGNMGKFINAGDKVRELVDELMKYKTASASFIRNFFG